MNVSERRKENAEGRKSYAETDSELLAEIKRLRRKPRGGKRSTWDEIAHQLNESEFDSRDRQRFYRQKCSEDIHL